MTAASAGYIPNWNPYPTPGDTGDPAKARQLLREAGYPSGLTLKAWSYPDGDQIKQNTVLQQSLSRAGITLKIIPVRNAQVMDYLTPENLRRGVLDLIWTEAVQLVALVELQVSVDAVPLATLVGLAVSVTDPAAVPLK